MENSINDLIIRIKNGYMARKETVVIRHSKYGLEVLKKLKELKFITDFAVSKGAIKTIEVSLAYNKNESKFTDVVIFSKPGRRFYVSYKDLRPVVSGLGYSILSTPIGILTNREARAKKVGGELLFNIW
jgi:small subunit ribosomal protein S8